MPDINLLPEELKRAEEKERARMHKKPKIIEVRLTSPEKEAPLGGKRFWKKLFGTKEDRAAAPLGTKEKIVLSAAHDVKKEESQGPDFLHVKREKRHALEPKKKRYKQEHYKKTEKAAEEREYVPEKRESAKPKKAKTKAIVFDSEKMAGWERIWNKLTGQLKLKLPPFTKAHETEHDILVNLMPEGIVTFADIKWKKIIWALVGSVLFAAVVTILGSFFLRQRLRSEQQTYTALQDDINRVYSDIESRASERDTALFLNDKLTLASSLIENHIYWTQFFKFLEIHTLDKVSYNDLTGTYGDPIVLTGQADSLSTILLQQEAFEKADDFVSGVSLDDFSVNPDETAQFTMTLDVLVSAWHK